MHHSSNRSTERELKGSITVGIVIVQQCSRCAKEACELYWCYVSRPMPKQMGCLLNDYDFFNRLTSLHHWSI